ncbi:sugar phosphate isomerase/epimerase family protein [candidate division KSB1 bacterium]
MRISRTFLVFFIVIMAFITIVPLKATAGDFPPELYVGGFLIGPQAYSFNRYSFFEAVDKAKEVGCSVIEAYPNQRLSPGDETQLNHNASPSVWARAKMKLEQTGVRVVNYGNVGLGNNEAENRKVFDFCKIMGIPIITSEPEEGSIDLLEKLVKEYDIKLAIHNHPQRPKRPTYKYWDPNYVLGLVKGRDPRIGACTDTGHWLRSNLKPVEALRLLEGRIISCHLKDLHIAGPDGHDVPYGKGASGVKAILDELKRQRFEGNIAIEYEYNWLTSVPEIKECVDFVREYGKVNP